jgi:hypothetical protein
VNKLNSSRRSANSAVKSKSADSKTPSQGPAPVWLITFTGLTLLVVGVVLLVPNQTSEQRFCLRILIALSSSGLASNIPGLFEINLRGLRSHVRTGGAISIFLLVYQVNPPTLVERFSNSQLPPDLAGKYSYTYTATTKEFPGGENQHGGEVSLQVDPLGGRVPISALGKRVWAAKEDYSGARKVPGNSIASWQINRIYYQQPYDFCYEYTTTDRDGTNSGNACLSIHREGGKIVRLVGTFSRNPPYQNILGIVELIRASD